MTDSAELVRRSAPIAPDHWRVLEPLIDHALELLGLAEHRQAHPLELSTSDRARLGLAGAVIGDPRYLIMDEATAYLDAADRATR